MLDESGFYKAVNSLKAEALHLARRCRRQLTDLEFLQCVAAKFGVEDFAERMLKQRPEKFFDHYGHEPEVLRRK